MLSNAEDLVKTLKEFGGLHTVEDFHKQKTIKSDTLSDRYRDIIIHQCPPSGPGITVLVMMKLLEKLGIEKYDVNSFERFQNGGRSRNLSIPNWDRRSWNRIFFPRCAI